MLDLISFMDVADGAALCKELNFVLKLVGLVVFAIKVVVPVLLVFYGMLDFVKAVMLKKEDEVKDALNKLKSRAIAAVVVFCVVSLVNVLMRFVGAEEYKACVQCINSPFDCDVEYNSDFGK
jgi:hypothetical protein